MRDVSASAKTLEIPFIAIQSLIDRAKEPRLSKQFYCPRIADLW